jgi:hypothetical protein
MQPRFNSVSDISPAVSLPPRLLCGHLEQVQSLMYPSPAELPNVDLLRHARLPRRNRDERIDEYWLRVQGDLHASANPVAAGRTRFYHGTVEPSAELILNAIDISVGNRLLDFNGKGRAFYLTPQFTLAAFCAFSNSDTSREDPVVVWFDVPNTLFSDLGARYIDLASNLERWALVIACCRRDSEQRLRAAELRWSNVAVVSGYVCGNVKQVVAGAAPARWQVGHAYVTQYVIHCQATADAFSQYPAGAVYFNSI